MERVFTVLMKEDEDGGYSVQCVELPSAISQGDTREEALENIKDAIRLVLAELESRVTIVSKHARKEVVLV